MSKEELRLVLEVLEKCHYYMIDAGLPNQSLLNEVFTAHKALEEALAEQPAQQQEPKVLMQEIARLHDRIKDLERDVEFLSRPAQQEPTVAAAWQQGYDQGVADERTSEANIGIAGFDVKVNPARNNPYSAKQPAQQEPAGRVYRYGKDSSGKPWHGVIWTAPGLDLPDGTLIYTSPQPSKPLTDEQQIAEAFRRHGLTLVKTATGYDVLKLGQITANVIKGGA